eukprot:g7382.t1
MTTRYLAKKKKIALTREKGERGGNLERQHKTHKRAKTSGRGWAEVWERKWTRMTQGLRKEVTTRLLERKRTFPSPRGDGVHTVERATPSFVVEGDARTFATAPTTARRSTGC